MTAKNIYMQYRVYIQALNGWPIDDWAVSAYMGFKEKQMDIYFFEHIDEVPVSPFNVVVAFIEDTNKYLEKLGLEPKLALNIPDELKEYAGRKTWTGILADLTRERIQLPVFVKPGRKSKEFIAGVITKKETFFVFKDLPDDTPMFFSKVVNFISEYRGYVIDGQLKGLKHYMGDFRIYPDVKIIDAAIAAYKSAPVGYSIDFGVTDKGATLLIECNDGWSLGNYGLNHTTYATLLLKRWIEMTKITKPLW